MYWFLIGISDPCISSKEGGSCAFSIDCFAVLLQLKQCIYWLVKWIKINIVLPNIELPCFESLGGHIEHCARVTI